MNGDHSDVGYHFMIGQDGTIYEGRLLTNEQAHLAREHCGLIGVLMLGDYSSDNKGLNVFDKIADNWDGYSFLTEPMLKSLVSLTNYLNGEYGIKYLGGHNEFHKILNSGAKEGRPCPGNIGAEVVNYLRRKSGMKSPSLMTAQEKSIAGN